MTGITATEYEIEELIKDRERLITSFDYWIKCRDWKAVQEAAWDIRVINAKLIVYDLMRRIQQEQ